MASPAASGSLTLAAPNSVGDSLERVGFAVDARALYIDDQLLGIEPVLLVRLVIEGSHERREIAFQLSDRKLDQLCEKLETQRQRMREIKNRMYLKEQG